MDPLVPDAASEARSGTSSWSHVRLSAGDAFCDDASAAQASRLPHQDAATMSEPLPAAPIAIRAATPADAALVHRLTLAAYEEYRGTLVPASGVFRESEADVAADLAHGGGAIAMANGEPAGCGRYELDPAGAFLYFGRLAVLPAQRRRGVAAALVGWFEQRAAACSIPEVRLGVRLSLPANLRLYTRLGYETYDYEERAGYGRVAACMRRRVLPAEVATPSGGVLALFGGPAGAGKTTLAAAWCATRARAVHLQLDAVRELIVAGRADPQQPGARAAEQYTLSARACLAAAGVFLAAGYDVALDDVFEPEPFVAHWQPLLVGLNWRLVIVRPSLAETLARAGARTKRVAPALSRVQHERTGRWPEPRRLDTTGFTIDESAALVRRMLAL